MPDYQPWNPWVAGRLSGFLHIKLPILGYSKFEIKVIFTPVREFIFALVKAVFRYYLNSLARPQPKEAHHD